MERGECQELEVESLNDVAFHRQDLLTVVSWIANEYQIVKLRHLIGFFVFGSDPQSSNAYKLELVAGNDSFAQVGVKYLGRDKQSFWLEFIFEMDINEPIE